MLYTPLPQRHANYSTVCLLALKDVRLERGVPQSNIAQFVGKTPSAWTKIELGQSPLLMDTLFGACLAMNINPSHFLAVVERLCQSFSYHNWLFYGSDLQGEDELLPLVQEYFASPGFESLKYRPNDRLTVQGFSNTISSMMPPTIVQYCCFPQTKEWIDNGAPVINPLSLVTTAYAGVHTSSI